MGPEENDLERALRLAAGDPAYRPDFYATLLESTVFIIGEADPVEAEEAVAGGTQISIQSIPRADGSPAVPFYSSLKMLGRAAKREVKYFSLPTRPLFEMTKGAVLTLNPGLTYGKEFLPAEIEALLATGANRLPEQRTTQEDQKVLLGQPASYPEPMVAAIKTLLSRRSQARAAYLFMMQDQTEDAKPHLVVGVEADGEIEALLRDIGMVAADTAPPGVPVDLLRIVPGEKGISEYCVGNVTPFYQKPPHIASGIQILRRNSQ